MYLEKTFVVASRDTAAEQAAAAARGSSWVVKDGAAKAVLAKAKKADVEILMIAGLQSAYQDIAERWSTRQMLSVSR